MDTAERGLRPGARGVVDAHNLLQPASELLDPTNDALRDYSMNYYGRPPYWH
ncbi:MAG: hypothetical protein ABSC19_11235 [Syntrophorhabdales bacterium]|jgi:hypothetical protein